MTGSHDKVQVVRDLSLDLFMEDRLENAIQIAEDTSIGAADFSKEAHDRVTAPIVEPED